MHEDLSWHLHKKLDVVGMFVITGESEVGRFVAGDSQGRK